jgi:hypothetical protein
VSEDPIAENAALEILAVLTEISPSGMREEHLYDQIVGRGGCDERIDARRKSGMDKANAQ